MDDRGESPIKKGYLKRPGILLQGLRIGCNYQNVHNLEGNSGQVQYVALINHRQPLLHYWPISP